MWDFQERKSGEDLHSYNSTFKFTINCNNLNLLRDKIIIIDYIVFNVVDKRVACKDLKLLLLVRYVIHVTVRLYVERTLISRFRISEFRIYIQFKVG